MAFVENRLGFQIVLILALSFSDTLKFSPLRSQTFFPRRTYVYRPWREIVVTNSLIGVMSPLRFQVLVQSRCYVSPIWRDAASTLSRFGAMSPLRFQALARDRCYVFPTCRDVGITFSRFGAKQCIVKESFANHKKHTEAYEAAKNFEAQQQAVKTKKTTT